MLKIDYSRKVIDCELRIEKNVCRLRLTDENTTSLAQPLNSRFLESSNLT